MLPTQCSHAELELISELHQSIWDYQVHCKPAKICFLPENIGAPTTFCGSFTEGVAKLI